MTGVAHSSSAGSLDRMRTVSPRLSLAAQFWGERSAMRSSRSITIHGPKELDASLTRAWHRAMDESPEYANPTAARLRAVPLRVRPSRRGTEAVRRACHRDVRLTGRRPPARRRHRLPTVAARHLPGPRQDDAEEGAPSRPRPRRGALRTRRARLVHRVRPRAALLLARPADASADGRGGAPGRGPGHRLRARRQGVQGLAQDPGPAGRRGVRDPPAPRGGGPPAVARTRAGLRNTVLAHPGCASPPTGC